MPRTKGRYVDFELAGRAAAGEARAKANQRLAEARWGRLTPAEKTEFINCLDEIEETKGLVTEQTPLAADADTAARALQGGPNADILAFMEAAIEAGEAYHELSLARRNHSVSLNNLSVAIQRHANHLASTVNHCQNLAHQATTAADQDENTRDTLWRDADVPPDLPDRNNGERKIYENWLTERHEGRLQRIRARIFMGDAPPGNNWHGCWPYAGGGQGYAAKWVQLDEEDNVSDRRVRKQAFKNRQEWASIIDFTDPVRVPNERWPVEFYCQRILGHQQGNTHAVVPEADPIAVVDNDYRSYSFTMEYCAHGDLEDLMNANRGPLPEPFLWRTFYALALAVFRMEWGHQNLQNQQPANGWAQVVHRDLKPGNVFLTTADPNFFPAYPTPLVGDFGASIMTTTDDELNPDIYFDGVHTHGFTAPEQRAYVNPRNFDFLDRERMLAHTNVYAVGVIMYALVKGHTIPKQPKWFGLGRWDSLRVLADPPAGPAYVERYSNRLRDLVDECLNHDPADRISTRNLLQRVSNTCHLNPATSGHPDDDNDNPHDDLVTTARILRNRDPAKSMINVPVGNLPAGDPRHLRYLPVDRYRRGLARVALPPIPPLPVP